MRSWPRGYPIGRECPIPVRFPPIGWPVSGTFGRYLRGRCVPRTLHIRRGERSPIAGHFSMRGFFRMAGTHLTPPLRRLAIFLVAIALVAAISPGLAVAAANGAPKPVRRHDHDPGERSRSTGNVLANDINNGDGDAHGHRFRRPGPEPSARSRSRPTATSSSRPPSTGTARRARPMTSANEQP